MTTTTSCTSSSSSAAAAAAQAAAERAAEAARRAAEAARRQAEAAQQQAAAARAAQAAAREAHQQVASTQKALTNCNLKPAERSNLTSRLDRQQKTYVSARENAVTQTQKAQSMLARAEDSQASLKSSVAQANTAASNAGTARPFAADRFSGIAATNQKTLDKVMGKSAAPMQSRLADLKAQVALRKVVGANPKPSSQWLQADAAGFTGRLADALEGASPEVRDRLLAFTTPGLKRAAEMLGDAGNENGDEASVKSLAANFSRIGNALPDDQAKALAYGVAEQLDDDSEQHYVDDGFQKFIDDGGSSRFRDLVAGALDAQDKGDARDELTQSGAGGFSIGGAIDDATGFVGGAFEDAAGAAWDGLSAAGNAVGTVATNSWNTITKDPLNAAAGFAMGPLGVANLASGGAIVDGGVDLAKKGLVELSEAAFSPLTNAVNGEIDKLKPNQSYSINIDGGVNVELAHANAEAQLSVSRNGDGSYCVSAGADVSASVLGKLKLPGISAGAGGRAEFSFDNAEDAKRAADTFVRLAASSTVPVAGPAAEGLATLASGDASFLADHLTAVNFKGDAAASISANLGGQTGLSGLNLSGQVQASQGVRVELEDGAPKAVVLGQQVHGEVAASGGLSAGPLAVGGEGSVGVSVTAQERFELDEPLSLDTLMNPGETISSTKVDGSVSFAFDGSAGSGSGLDTGVAGVSTTQGTGRLASVTVSGDPAAIISDVAPSILRGEFAQAGHEFKDAVGIRAESRSYNYQAGQAGFDLELASASVSTMHQQLNTLHETHWGRPPPSAEEKINELSFENFLETVPEAAE